MNILLSPDARKVLDVGTRNHWGFRVIGTGEPPAEPVRIGKWVVHMLDGKPEHGQDRIEEIRRAGVPIKAVVIAHERPLLLSAQNDEYMAGKSISPSAPGRTLQEDADLFGAVLGTAAAGTVLFLGLMASALACDPALFVVLSDNSWILVSTWYEEEK